MTRGDSLRLVGPPLGLTVSFVDPSVGAAVVAAYSRFVDVRPGRATGAPVLDCVVDPDRHDALLSGRVNGTPVLRTAGSGPSLATGVSIGETLVLAKLDRGGRSILEREIRMFFTRQLLGHGWVPLHAAGLVGPAGRAILLMGPKMAGKTTTLLSLLRTGEVGLMANDKLFVRYRDGELPMVRSLPVAAGIRTTTLALFPELEPLSAEREMLHVDNVGTTRATDPGKLFAPVQAIADAFGVPIVPTAPLGAIIAVRFKPNRAHAWPRPLTQVELTELITNERLDSDSRWRAEWLGAACDAVTDGLPLANVPAFRLELSKADAGRVATAITQWGYA